MTGSYATATVLFSDKISTVTHHHLLMRVHVKFDLENWNYGSWENFFDKLCQSYEIVKDNERSRTIVLKAELRSLKLGDLCIDAYFRKIESIATILTSLGSPVSSEDVVTFALEGFLDKYDHVYDIMHHRDTFPDLKTARSMLITEEMWLKFKSQSLPVDSSSSSPVVLMAESSIYRRPSNLQNNTDELLVKLLGRLGLSNNSETPTGTHTHALKHSTVSPISPAVFYTSASPGPLYYTTIAQHVVNPAQQAQSGSTTTPLGLMGLTVTSGQETTLPHTFTAGTLHDPTTGAWNTDTGASSHLNDSVTNLNDVFNTCIYPFVSVGDEHSIPVTNTGHSILPTSFRYIHLNNVLITPHIVKNLIFVCQFVRDNNCIVEFDAFGFSVNDFMTHRVLLRCDSTGDLYPVTAPSPIPHAFLVNQHTWHQHLGHQGSEVQRHLVSHNFISCNKLVLCHACQLGKHVRPPFVSSNTVVTSCFDIIHSDVWTSPILSLSGFKYYVLFLDHYSQFVWVYPLINKSDVLSKFVLFCKYVHTQFKCEIRSFQCDHGGELDNRNLHKLFADNGLQFRFSGPKTSQQNDGTLSRYKARLVANGSTQLKGVDVDDTLSPVIKPCTIQTVFSLAASRHWPIYQLDVKTAFLHNDLSETRKYVVEILERAHMVNCNHSRTPVDIESKLGVDGDPICLDMHDPREPHLSALKRILRYVHGTLNYGLQLLSETEESRILCVLEMVI
ncbi:ribonuclease H-like domain-containing protein [Tanacetum coccineum]